MDRTSPTPLSPSLSHYQACPAALPTQNFSEAVHSSDVVILFANPPTRSMDDTAESTSRVASTQLSEGKPRVIASYFGPAVAVSPKNQHSVTNVPQDRTIKLLSPTQAFSLEGATGTLRSPSPESDGSLGQADRPYSFDSFFEEHVRAHAHPLQRSPLARSSPLAAQQLMIRSDDSAAGFGEWGIKGNYFDTCPHIPEEHEVEPFDFSSSPSSKAAVDGHPSPIDSEGEPSLRGGDGDIEDNTDLTGDEGSSREPMGMFLHPSFSDADAAILSQFPTFPASPQSSNPFPNQYSHPSALAQSKDGTTSDNFADSEPDSAEPGTPSMFLPAYPSPARPATSHGSWPSELSR